MALTFSVFQQFEIFLAEHFFTHLNNMELPCAIFLEVFFVVQHFYVKKKIEPIGGYVVSRQPKCEVSFLSARGKSHHVFFVQMLFFCAK